MFFRQFVCRRVENWTSQSYLPCSPPSLSQSSPRPNFLFMPETGSPAGRQSVGDSVGFFLFCNLESGVRKGSLLLIACSKFTSCNDGQKLSFMTGSMLVLVLKAAQFETAVFLEIITATFGMFDRVL